MSKQKKATTGAPKKIEKSVEKSILQQIARRKIVPQQLYSSRLPINSDKKNDLISLVDDGSVPPVYRDFFSNIPACKKVRDSAVHAEGQVAEEYEIEEVYF